MPRSHLTSSPFEKQFTRVTSFFVEASSHDVCTRSVVVPRSVQCYVVCNEIIPSSRQLSPSSLEVIKTLSPSLSHVLSPLRKLTSLLHAKINLLVFLEPSNTIPDPTIDDLNPSSFPRAFDNFTSIFEALASKVQPC